MSDEAGLFDYAAGTSAKTFAIDTWPGQAPAACRLAGQAPAARAKPLPKGLARSAAAKRCSGIVSDGLKSSCVDDAMVAGETELARAYQLADQAWRKVLTGAPVAVLPQHNEAGLGTPVTFTWKRASTLDGSAVSYTHCVWDAGKRFSFKSCEPVSAPGGTGPVTTTVTRLEPGRSYFWKVIAEDGKGDNRESVISRFIVKQ